MGTLSMDLRERILSAYDAGEGTREDIALRFRVSLGMVKKLLQLRRSGKGIEAGYARCGRKAMIQSVHRQRLRELLSESPDLTLEQLRTHLGLSVTVQAIHYALADMDLTYKKRRSGPASRTART
jgi:transposase